MRNGENLRGSGDFNPFQENNLFNSWSVVLLWSLIFPLLFKGLVLGQVPWTYISISGIPGDFSVTGNVHESGVCENLRIFLMRGSQSLMRISKVLCLEKVWGSSLGKFTCCCKWNFSICVALGEGIDFIKGSCWITNGGL